MSSIKPKLKKERLALMRLKKTESKGFMLLAHLRFRKEQSYVSTQVKYGAIELH